MGVDALSRGDFTFVAELVNDQAAIVLEQGKEYLVEARLRPLVRRFKLATIEELVAAARPASARDLRDAIVESLTTNETHFFRDRPFYDTLREHMLPRMIEARRSQRKLSMWCGASSSGQEPYSILMMISEHFPELLAWDLKFVVSDYSKEMIERTRAGLYSQHEVNRGLPSELLKKYFLRQGLDWQIRPDLRRRLDVREINLARPWPGLTGIDLVFLRNVLIYFGLETKREVLRRARSALADDGILFLGGSESLFGIDDGFERAALGSASCYTRRPAGQP